MICLFLTCDHPGADVDRIGSVLRSAPGMTKALMFTPAKAHDPFLDDGTPPALVLECYFSSIEPMEAALAADGHFAALRDVAFTQQAMLARHYPVPDPAFRTPAGAPHCTYLVAYQGAAEDLNLWLSHYIAHHPPIMARFPGIRQIEISTRIDWCSGLAWPRADAMQRNKVVFDSANALDAALNSPVRDEMRADFHTFPPFSGPVTHYAMNTFVVTPEGQP